jgi:hypothetical protein
MRLRQQLWRIEMTRKTNRLFLAGGFGVAGIIGVALFAARNLGLFYLSAAAFFWLQIGMLISLFIFIFLGIVPYLDSKLEKYSIWLTEPVRKDLLPEPELEVGDWPSAGWGRRYMRKRRTFARSIGLLIED